MSSAASSSGLTGVALGRVRKELTMLYEDPPPGISAWWANEAVMGALVATKARL